MVSSIIILPRFVSTCIQDSKSTVTHSAISIFTTLRNDYGTMSVFCLCTHCLYPSPPFKVSLGIFFFKSKFLKLCSCVSELHASLQLTFCRLQCSTGELLPLGSIWKEHHCITTSPTARSATSCRTDKELPLSVRKQVVF